MDKLQELEAMIGRLAAQGAHTISVRDGDKEITVQFAPRMPQTDLSRYNVDKAQDTTDDKEDEDLIYAASM